MRLMSARPYAKPWLSVDDQITLLKQRGMVFHDLEEARHVLGHVDYYRLSGYTYPFRETQGAAHSYPGSTCFRDVLRLYHLDADLRHALLRAIGVLEVDLRSNVIRVFAGRHGPMGHTAAAHFRPPVPPPPPPGKPQVSHAQWLKGVRGETKRSSDDTVQHCRRNYQGFPDLPIWVSAGLMSFGTLSKMIDLLIKADQREVAKRYGVQRTTLVSWVHHLTHVRNMCAHHSRLWDRVWAVKPTRPPGKLWVPELVPDAGRPYMTLLIISQMLQKTIPQSTAASGWRMDVVACLEEISQVPQAGLHIGLPEKWESHPLLA